MNSQLHTKNGSKLIVLLFACLNSVMLLADIHNHYYFRHYEVEDGLSQNMIYSILQDQQGYIWLGTQDGLNRYDGSTFKIFKKIKSDSTSLGNNAIFSLTEDSREKIWVGTYNGISIYDPQTEHFSKFNAKTPDGVSVNGVVRDIIEDHEGKVWIADSKVGIFSYNKNHELKLYKLKNIDIVNIRKIAFDSNHNLWVATYREGLFCIQVPTGEIKHYLINENSESNNINDLHFINDTTLLLATSTSGVQTLSTKTGKFETLIGCDVENKPLFARRIFKAANGDYWIGTESGVYIYNFKNKHIKHLKHTFNDPYSITDNAVHSIFQDREGGIWIGTFFGGVNYYSNIYAQFEKYYPLVGQNAISGKSISEFCEDNNANIWIGTEDAGLNLFNPKDFSFRNNIIPAKNIHALLFEEHYLWVGTFEDGLYKIDTKNMQYKTYKSSLSSNALNSNSIYSIFKDHSGTLWIGTILGLQTYNSSTNAFTTIQKGIIDCQVNDILETDNNMMWFATIGQGLFSYNANTKQWKHYASLNNDIEGSMITCLALDSHNRLWIGTEGAGMCMYDKETDGFTHFYNTNNGLPNNVVYKIVEDDEGMLWGSTNKGLFKLNPNINSLVSTFTHSNGLLGDQFNYKSGLKSRNGKLYFGLIKGFVSFFPNQLQTNALPPPLVINSFQIFNKEVIPGSNHAPLQQSISYTKEINLPRSSSIFSLGFSALSYVSPEGNSYAYMLDGRDRKWVYTNQLHRITYSDLPVGSYTFHVKASNSDGVWNEKGSSIKINILPPYYLSLPAYITYFILVSLLLMYFVRSSMKRIKTLNMQKIHELEVRKEKELYHAKIEFFTNITHEIRTPLSLIKAPLEEVMNQMNTQDKHWDHLSIIHRNANRLLKLVNELLDFRKAESEGLTLNLMHVDIVLLIKDIVDRFTPAAKLKGIEVIQYLHQNTFFADVDSEIVTKIISNVFNNALKHANQLIIIKFQLSETNVIISISNDGDLIAPNHAAIIFDPFVKLDQHSQGSGLGLPLAKSLIELHHGKLFLNTDETTLTCFVIELPICQKRVVNLDNEEQGQTNSDANQLENLAELMQTDDMKTILSVEDNEEFQNFMTKQLSSTYHIVKVKNGKDALDMLSHANIHLIISDIMMPQMDGMELCNAIKSDIKYSHIPIILLTAKTTLQSKIDGLKIGADDYIEKPYSIDFLRARIENLLNSRWKLQENYRHNPEIEHETITHTSADKEFINKLIQLIHTHINEVDLDVDFLANAMNMSRATFYRKVKSLSELTPNDFIRLIRLKKAVELIKAKEYRINEIAFLVGFNSPSYFSKCFLKEFGVLPKDFLK